MNLQPTHLNTEDISILPLEENDFEFLYKCASNPEIWEQHPSKNRYQKDVFIQFFKEAIASKGAFKIIDTKSNSIIGSTRFYDYNKKVKSVVIGYTFLAKEFWGTGINTQVKKLLLNYAFQFVDRVEFHIGSENKRSQLAIEKIDALKILEKLISYPNEPDGVTFIYEIKKENYLK